MTRRGVTLVLVLMCLTLAAAVIVPLAAISGTYAVTVNYRGDAPPHRLAGDSLIAILPEWLERSPVIREQLSRDNWAELRLFVGEIRVDAILQDDSAKLPVRALFESHQPQRLRAALERVLGEVPLAPLAVAGEFTAAGCFDDLFTDATDAELFGGLDRAGVAEVVSPLGERVNFRRATPAVLEAALADLKPGAGIELARLAAVSAKEGAAPLLDRIELPESARRKALARLTDRSERLSLRIRTSHDSVIRWRYVICTTDEPPIVLVDWEIAP